MRTKVMQQIEIFANPTYRLSTLPTDDGIVLKMLVKTSKGNSLYTKDYPQAVSLLQAIYPRVLETKCYNYKNQPFEEEVTDTEVAHLFEHILIQKMTDLYPDSEKLRIYNGLTSWDWNEHKYGTFTIKIDAGVMDLVTFFKAITETIEIFNQVIK